MAIRVYKVADIIENHVVCSPQRNYKQTEVTAVLTNLQPVSDPHSDCSWTLGLEIGEGPGDVRFKSIFPPSLKNRLQLMCQCCYVKMTPLHYTISGITYLCRNARLEAPSQSEMRLRCASRRLFTMKNSSFRAAVANLEAALAFQKSESKSDPIPKEVKLLVWTRDGGSCVRCGSPQELHFDHIIPVSKGASNTAANIQILCQPCNYERAIKSQCRNLREPPPHSDPTR